MNDSFYRVTLEGLALAQLLSLQIRNLGQEQWAKPLFTTVLALLDSVDRDLELKEKTITSAAVFINQLGDLIGDDLNKSLDVIHRRLNNELTRLSAVRAVHIITVSNHPLNLEVFLPRASDDLATFLSQSDRILRLAALRCLYTVWFKYPRLIGPKCLETVLDLLPRFLVSEQDLQGAQLAIHLVSLLLELGEDDNAELGVRISKFVSADAFNQHLIDLTHSPLLRGQALEAMLRLMRAIGRRSSHHESEQALISFFLSRLLEPLNGGGLLSSSPHRHNGNRTPLSRDALPSLAQCITELLSELPAVSGAKSSFGTLRSVSIAVDRLIAAVKNPDSSPTEIYLNLLILGELGRKTDLGNRTDLREIFISCLLVPTTSASPNNVETPGALGAAITEEVKPAAALGLGRLVVGQPDVLLPFLVDRISQVVAMYVDPGSAGAANQHQLYHMLQALREVIVNLAGFSANDVLKTHLDAIWTLLIASSGVPEEGTRTIVAECLGHLIFVSPRQLIGRLRQQLNSPEANSSPLIRCTLVTAVKFIIIVTDQDVPSPHRTLGQIRLDSLDWPNSVAPYAIPRDESAAANANVTVLEEIDSVLRADHPPPLLDFLTRLADSDMLVRRAALVALNTSAHHRPGLIRPLLNVSLEYPPGHSTTLLKLLYAETAIRPELIREVEMGPFKHKEDDGLDLRKCAFECMSTLLETCLDKLDVSEFLLPLIDGLKDHTDIKLLCYQMVQQIARIRPLEISAKMDALAVPLKTILLSKPKEDWVKQEMEKMQELTRCAISVIVSFKSIDDADKNRFYLDLLRTIEADPSLKPLYANAIAVDSTSGPSPPLYSLYSKRVPYSAYSSLN
ncbi:unnamed protein product [Dicrocoelium dendriticum]|nr:unnamed protein product [Dicrocoelium dendriticum]